MSLTFRSGLDGWILFAGLFGSMFLLLGLVFKERDHLTHSLDLPVKWIRGAPVHGPPSPEANVSGQVIQILGANLQILLAAIPSADMEWSAINGEEPAKFLINGSDYPSIRAPIE